MVYDVLDENGVLIMDEDGRVWDIHTEYPPHFAEVPVGTELRIG